MELPNKDIVGKRFLKKKESYKKQASIQKKASQKLFSAVSEHKDIISSLYEVGCGTGFLTEQILANFTLDYLYVNDLTGGIVPEIDDLALKYNCANYDYLIGDAETIDMPKGINAIVSASTFQWFHDLPTFIKKSYDALDKDGVFAFSSFGPENFIEIRKSAGKGLRYLTLAQLEALLKPYFNVTYKYEWKEKLYFDEAIKVLRHIQATGVNGLGGAYFGKERMQSFVREYQRKHSEGRQVFLTYHPVIIVAQKK